MSEFMSAISYQKSRRIKEVDFIFETEYSPSSQDHIDVVSALDDSEVYSQSSVATRESYTKPNGNEGYEHGLDYRGMMSESITDKTSPIKGHHSPVVSTHNPNPIDHQNLRHSQDNLLSSPSPIMDNGGEAGGSRYMFPNRVGSRDSVSSRGSSRSRSSSLPSISEPHFLSREPKEPSQQQQVEVSAYTNVAPPTPLSPRRTPIGSDAFEIGFEERISNSLKNQSHSGGRGSPVTWLSSAEKKQQQQYQQYQQQQQGRSRERGGKGGTYFDERQPSEKVLSIHHTQQLELYTKKDTYAKYTI